MGMIRGLAFDRAITHVAFDRSSVRSKDVDGRLHIALTNISKATVNPYYGNEIPNFEELKLDPDKVYYLLRCPEELAKAAKTFNNLPILDEHIPVNAKAPQQEMIIGSSGTDADFDSPYLQNSAVVWTQNAIDDIEAERRKEWSCGYYYTADMTPGEFNGLRYDGVMRNIIGNHIALVDEGRAGADVVVGDRLPGKVKMAVLKSRAALMLNGALAALIAPQLAQDKKLDLTGQLSGVTRSNLGKTKKALATKIVAAAKPFLAQDGELDVDDVVKLIGAVEGVEPDPAEDDDIPDMPDADDGSDPSPAVDGEDDPMAKVLAFLKGKLSDEDMAEIGNICSGGATDDLPEPPADDPKDVKDQPKAMDAAAVSRRVSAMRVAEREVQPFIGEVKVVVDSPEAIYKLALDHAKVSTKGVHPSAFRAMVGMMPKGKTDPKPIALDHASASSDFAKRFGDNHLIAS